MKILIVDDDSIFCMLMQRSLVAGGDHVEIANDGAAAEAKFVPPFDLVLLDLRLPDKSGLEVLKRIRKFSSSLPVLIMSGQQELAAELDPYTFFACKPVEIEALAQVVSDHRAKAKQLNAQ